MKPPRFTPAGGEYLPTVRVASASDPELLALASIVAALQRLDAGERARVLRYLNHRYAPSERPSPFRGGAIVPNMPERSSG